MLVEAANGNEPTEKELEALASRAGLGNQLPMAALQAEESSEDEDEV